MLIPFVRFENYNVQTNHGKVPCNIILKVYEYIRYSYTVEPMEVVFNCSDRRDKDAQTPRSNSNQGNHVLVYIISEMQLTHFFSHSSNTLFLIGPHVTPSLLLLFSNHTLKKI